MRVVIAKASGFCDGVKRAMRIALMSADRHGALAADGPLVHNPTACELLSLHGIAGKSDCAADAPLLIRAHGIPPDLRRVWEETGRRLIDATCKHVARNQRLAAEAGQAGELVLIAGDSDHAEVKAVAGSAGDNVLVVKTPGDIARLTTDRPVFMLAQTTFSTQVFQHMTDMLLRLRPGSRVADTICRATHERQREAKELAARVEAVVVVGGRRSANTRRLADAVREAGKPAFSVETADDLRPEDFSRFSRVGVTSGASTPGWLTQEVVNRLRGMGRGTIRDRLRALLIPLAAACVTTALAAAGLALAAGRFLGGTPSPALAAAGAGFVLFAHILGRRLPENAAARRLPFIDNFYRRRRTGILILAWGGAAMALVLGAMAGRATFLLFVAAVAATTVYAWSVRRQAASSPVRAAPARNVCMAAGWALTLAVPAGLASGWAAGTLGAAAFCFLLCFGGTLLRDLHDIASDSLIGIRTLPATLGIRRGRWLALTTLAAAGCLALAGLAWPPHGAGTFFPAALALIPCLGLSLLELMRRRSIRDAVSLQALVDGMGVAAGLAAWLLP